jgi:hypothetical protein
MHELDRSWMAAHWHFCQSFVEFHHIILDLNVYRVILEVLLSLVQQIGLEVCSVKGVFETCDSVLLLFDDACVLRFFLVETMHVAFHLRESVHDVREFSCECFSARFHLLHN